MKKIRASTKRSRHEGGWVYHGRVLQWAPGEKYAKDIWTCRHKHVNRDHDSVDHASARTCAEWMIHVYGRGGTDDLAGRQINAGGTWQGLHDLRQAAPAQLEWLAERAEERDDSRSQQYPEHWLKMGEGPNARTYRAKLWERDDDNIRLFVAGPFGTSEYVEGHYDVVTGKIGNKSAKYDGRLHAEWMAALERFLAEVGTWAPESRTAGLRDALRKPRMLVPARYAIKIRRNGTRTYDIVEINTEEVIESHTNRVVAYRRAEELNREARHVET